VLMLLFILAITGLPVAAIVIVLMAHTLLRPPRMNDGKAAYVLKRLSPGDLELVFEDAFFDVRDERTGNTIRLTGWWIPHASAGGKCAILVHGYADAKVGAIAWAPTFHSLGWNILAIDLRAHGESEGTQSTAGFFERHDLNQVINQLRVARPRGTRQVVLFGVSLGAAVVAAAAATRDDLAAVILESPFADFITAVKTHAAHMGMPGALFQNLSIRLAERLSGAAFNEIRPIDLIPKIPCPLLVIQSAGDPFLPTGDDERIRRAVASRPESFGPSACRTLPADHAMALAHDPERYRRMLHDFLADAMSNANEVFATDKTDEHG